MRRDMPSFSLHFHTSRPHWHTDVAQMHLLSYTHENEICKIAMILGTPVHRLCARCKVGPILLLIPLTVVADKISSPFTSIKIQMCLVLSITRPKKSINAWTDNQVYNNTKISYFFCGKYEMLKFIIINFLLIISVWEVKFIFIWRIQRIILSYYFQVPPVLKQWDSVMSLYLCKFKCRLRARSGQVIFLIINCLFLLCILCSTSFIHLTTSS